MTEAIRQPDVTNAVSAVSKHAKVREEMVALQPENWSSQRSCHGWSRYWYCSFTKAEVKIFLVASVEERAERRFKENQEKGIGWILKP